MIDIENNLNNLKKQNDLAIENSELKIKQINDDINKFFNTFENSNKLNKDHNNLWEISNTSSKKRKNQKKEIKY
jgi:hypothetical protein